MAQSTTVENITNTSADVIGNNPLKNKTLAVTLDVTAFGDETKEGLIQKKATTETIDGFANPSVFNLNSLNPGTRYTAFVDYVSGSSNAPTLMQFFKGEVKYIGLGTGDNTVCVSNNGKDWIGSNDIFSVCGTCGLWDGTKWLIGGSGINILATSTDGKIWSLIREGPLHVVNGVAFMPEFNTYVAVGVGETTPFIYSKNLTDWTRCEPNGLTFANDVATDGTIFVAVGDGMSFSFDGVSWVKSETSPTETQNKVVWTGSYWISFATNSISLSDNGIVWNTTTNPYGLRYAAWNGLDKWIAIKDGGVSTSGDGTTWATPSEKSNLSFGQTITYGDKLVCGIDAKSSGKTTFLYSENNGQTWTPSEQILNVKVTSIVYKRALPNGSGSYTTCPIMQTINQTNEGFVFNLNVSNTPPYVSGNPQFGVIDSTRPTDGTKLDYGFKVDPIRQFGSREKNLTINVIIDGLPIVPIELGYLDNRLTYVGINPNYYRYLSKETYSNNSVSLLQKIFRENIYASSPLTPQKQSQYTSLKNRFEYDTKYAYYQFINKEYSDKAIEYSQTQSLYVDSRTGFSNYINGSIEYFNQKYDKYKDVNQFITPDTTHTIMYMSSVIEETTDPCNISIIYKNNLISIYVNYRVALILRPPSTKIGRTFVYYSNNTSSSGFSTTYGDTTQDALLSRKAYAHSLLFNNLLTNTEKDILYYTSFFKTIFDLDTVTKNTLQSYDLPQVESSNVKVIFSAFTRVLAGKSVGYVTQMCCTLYSLINSFRPSIRTQIQSYLTNYTEPAIAKYYAIRDAFIPKNYKFLTFKDTIGLLLSSPEITQLTTECLTKSNGVQTLIDGVNTQNTLDVLTCIETTFSRINVFSELVELYPELGDPITPATMDRILSGFDDGNGNGWFYTYYSNIDQNLLLTLQTDNTQYVNNTIQYLKSITDGTPVVASDPSLSYPVYPTTTSSLKTYFRNRHLLIQTLSDTFENVASVVMQPYIDALNDLTTRATKTLIDEFLDVFVNIFAPYVRRYPTDPTDMVVGLGFDYFIKYYLFILDKPQTIPNDIIFTITDIDSNLVPINIQLTIQKGVYTIQELVDQFQTKLRTYKSYINVTIDSKKRIAIGGIGPDFNIIFNTIESANIFGFTDIQAFNPAFTYDINIGGYPYRTSNNPLLMNYSRFQFYLDRLAFLRMVIDKFNNRDTILTTASNSSKGKIDAYFKNIISVKYFPYALTRITVFDANIDDSVFISKEDNCTSGLLSSKRTTYLAKRTQIQSIISAGVDVSDLYSSVVTLKGLLDEIEVINTYFLDAKAGFDKYDNAISTLDGLISSYRISLQREARMVTSYMNNAPPEILLYTGVGEDFIRSVLPTDTRFWTIQPSLNILDHAEFRLNWPYYDLDIVSYNGSVYKCTGLAIDGIEPTNTRYWKLETEYDPVTLTGNTYSATERYTHYSTVVYNNAVYSCIYEFPVNDLIEYEIGNQYIAFSPAFGNTKLQEAIPKLATSNSMLDIYSDTVYSRTSDNRTPIMVGMMLSSLANDIEYTMRQLSSPTRKIFVTDTINRLTNSVVSATEESDKPLYDEKISVGNTTSSISFRFREIFENSIYNSASTAYDMHKTYENELLNNKQLILDVYGTPEYSVTGIKAKYLYDLGYQGDTTTISLNTYPQAAASLSFTNVIQSKNTRTSVKGYSPAGSPFVWKRIDNKRLYDSSTSYNINDVVYQFDRGTLKSFKCISINNLVGYTIDIDPLINRTYWQQIPLDESNIQLKTDSANYQYEVNDTVLFINGTTIEKYICIQRCDGTAPVTASIFWQKDSRYISPAKLYDNNQEYVLNSDVLVANTITRLLDLYVCINVDVPLYGVFDCVVQYQSTIQNVSPSDSSLIWELQTTYSDKVYSGIYFTSLSLSSDTIQLYLERKQEVPYSSEHKYKVGNLVVYPDLSVGVGDTVDIKSLRYRGTSPHTPPRTSDYSTLSLNDAAVGNDNITYVWNGSTWVPKFRIRCYKCIRAPDRFGYYTYYDGTFKKPGVPCYGLGPKSDMWRQRFFPRIMRYQYALKVEHTKLEINEKYTTLQSYFTDNSEYDFRAFTFKCPSASTTWTTLKNKFLNSRQELNLPVINYTTVKNFLLSGVIREIQNVQTIINDYRKIINDIKQQFFESNIVQIIVNADETKYDLVDLDKFRYVDLGYGSKDTSLEPKTLSTDMIEQINGKLFEAVRAGAISALFRGEQFDFNGWLQLEREKISINQGLIKEYETKIQYLFDYVKDLIGFDMLESILSAKDSGTLNFGIGGICDGVVIPLRGIDIDYSFIPSWSRFDSSGKIVDSTLFGDILTTKFNQLHDNFTVVPPYKTIDLTPKAATWEDYLRGIIVGTLIGLTGIGSLVSNPNQIKKQAYMRAKEKFKNNKLAYEGVALKTTITAPIANAAIAYSQYKSAYNSQVITAARILSAQEDVNQYHINRAQAAHAAMIAVGVSNILTAQIEINEYTTTINFEITRTREKRIALADAIGKGDAINAKVKSEELGKPIAPAPGDVRPVDPVDPPKTTDITTPSASSKPPPVDPPKPPPAPPKDMPGKIETIKGQIDPSLRSQNVPGTTGRNFKVTDGTVAFRSGQAPIRTVGANDPRVISQNGSKPANFTGNGREDLSLGQSRLRKTTPSPPKLPSPNASSLPTIKPDLPIEKPSLALQDEIKGDILDSLKRKSDLDSEISQVKAQAQTKAAEVKVAEADLAGTPTTDPTYPAKQTEVTRVRGQYQERVTTIQTKVSGISKVSGKALSVFEIGLALASFKDMSPEEAAINAAMMIGMGIAGKALSKIPGIGMFFAALSIVQTIIDQDWCSDTIY